MEVNDYVRRQASRRALFAFVEAWRSKLKKMRLVLKVQESDLLGEAAFVELRHARRDSCSLSIEVDATGQFYGRLESDHSPLFAHVTDELLSGTLDGLLYEARARWQDNAMGRVRMPYGA